MHNEALDEIINFGRNNWFKVCSLLVILFCAFAFYQSAVAIPREKLNRAESEAFLSDFKRQQRLDSCLATALNDYNLNWEGQCIAQKKESNCALPKFIGDDVDVAFAHDKSNCYSAYKP